MPCFLNVESFLISSGLIASQLLLEIPHCIPLSPQSVSSHLISTHLMSSQLFSLHLSSHLMSSLPSSALLSWSRPFSSLLMSFEVFSSHLSWAYLSFSDFHSSSQLFSALRSSCKLILCVLISSLLFSHLPSSSHTYSADLSSCQLVSPHLSSSQRSQIISPFLWPKTCSKNGSRRQSKQPLRFPQRRFDTEKLLHTASFYTEKLIQAEAFTQSQGSFYSQQARQSKKKRRRKITSAKI